MLILDRLKEEINKLKRTDITQSSSFFGIVNTIKNILTKKSLLRFSADYYKFRTSELIYRNKLSNAFGEINDDLKTLYEQTKDIKQPDFTQELADLEQNITLLELDAFISDPNYFSNTTDENEIMQVMTSRDVFSNSNITFITNYGFTTAQEIINIFSGIDRNEYTFIPTVYSFDNKKRICDIGKPLGYSVTTQADDRPYSPANNDIFLPKGYDLSIYRTNQDEKELYFTYLQNHKTNNETYRSIITADDAFSYSVLDKENLQLNLKLKFNVPIFLIMFKAEGNYPNIMFNDINLSSYDSSYTLFNLNTKVIELFLNGTENDFLSEIRIPFDLKQTKTTTRLLFQGKQLIVYDLTDLPEIESKIVTLEIGDMA